MTPKVLFAVDDYRYGGREVDRRLELAAIEKHPGKWTDGDRLEITEHGGYLIPWRCDATLNRGGVRIGTA